MADRNWRGIGPIAAIRLPPAARVCRVRCREGLRRGGDLRARAARVHQRPGAARVEEARGLPGVRHALHAGHADGSADGFERGRLRRLLSIPAPHRAGGSERLSGPVQFTCPLPLAVKDRIVLGHGSGGKAQRRVAARRLSAFLSQPDPQPAGRPGGGGDQRRAPRFHDGFLRGEAAVLSAAATSGRWRSTAR